MICKTPDVDGLELAPVATAGRSAHAEASDCPAIDLPRLEAAVREILAAVGEDPRRDGLKDTPRRVAKAYAEIFAGLRDDPARHLSRVFNEHSDEMVVLRNIDFFSVCEHHLMPFVGKAHIAYLPEAGKVVGLSKLARTVEVFARRPQVQERLTSQIADFLVETIHPRGVAVWVEGQHMCAMMRGVKKSEASMTTRAMRGEFENDAALRAEFTALVSKSHSGD